MTTKLYSTEAFHHMVRGFVKEAIHEQMIKELERLNLKELGGVEGSSPTSSSGTSTGTSGTTGAMGTKSGLQTSPGNDDPANSVLVPGTNLPLNAGLLAASKEKNFKKKAELIKKISDQLAAMKGVVVKEELENLEEWQAIHDALSNSLRQISNDYSELFDDFISKGITGANANKGVRALENVFDNMRQDIQMKKDVNATKTRAAKAMGKSPLIKKYMPAILGGDFNANPLGI